MSITNRSVNVKDSTNDLVTQLEEYEQSYDCIMDLPDDQIDNSQLEWLESGIEQIEAELERRDDDPENYHDDTPSLQDSGIELGSYAS